MLKLLKRDAEKTILNTKRKTAATNFFESNGLPWVIQSGELVT